MSFLRSLVLAVVAMLAVGSVAVEGQSTGTMCLLFYSALGDIDFPWSVAVSLTFSYDVTPQTNSLGTYQPFYNAFGRYTYTNKFGSVTNHEVCQCGGVGNWYLGSPFPVDADGLQLDWTDVDYVQLPGVGPVYTYDELLIANTSSGYIGLGDAFRVDDWSQGWHASNLPGFANRDVPAASVNGLYADFTNCEATITSLNGKVAFVEPHPNENYATTFEYSYTIGDGSSYHVTTSLTITASGVATDELGNQYQTITGVSGSRTYYYGDATPVVSTVTGLSTAAGSPSQRWYPFALIQSSNFEGGYNTNTAPFLDGNGLGFSISPAAPVNGQASGSSNSDITVQFVSTGATNSPVILNEASYTVQPSASVQSQTYTLG